MIAELAKVVPELTGVWWDEPSRSAILSVRTGGPTVLGADAHGAIRALSTHSAWLGGEIRLVERDGPLLSKLLEWRISARVLLSDPRVSSLDLDERAGAIVLGVYDLGARDAIVGLAATAGIPIDVVRIEQDAMQELQISVRDKRRPRIENGYQVSFQRNNGDIIFCTHGADAIIGGPQYGFITNSHCSPDGQIGTITNHLIHQHLFTSLWLHVVGFELLDAPLFSGPTCGASPLVCRYSDAMFVGYAGSSGGSGLYGGKKIAETTPVGTSGAGGLTVASYRPAPTSSNLIPGMVVRKTGRTSGTTQGVVFQTCADLPAGSSTRYLLCQDRFLGWSRPGDSGSPVFWGDFSSPTSSVYHVGVLWGGDTLVSHVNLSPWYGITSDLGVFY